MMLTRTLPFVALLAGVALTSHGARADAVYKSVDSAGNVTYSSTPPRAGGAAQTVDVPPAPSETETREAQERAKKTQAQANELEGQRQDKAAKEAEAERERQAAKPPAPTVVEKPIFIPQPFGGMAPIYPGTPLPQPRTISR